ncbi:MAG: biotin/lipoyl-containing protein, partial [Rhodanobacter sp.]
MADLKEARVPDIGHADVPVIEVLVKAGDRVEKEQGLITLESDKATMEVPAPFAGTVKEVKLKVGDEVSEGALIAVIETDGAAVSASPSPAPAEGRGEGAPEAVKPPAPAPAPAPAAAKPAPAVVQGAHNAPEGDVSPQARPPFDANIVMPGDAPYASPAVRAFARELGVD